MSSPIKCTKRNVAPIRVRFTNNAGVEGCVHFLWHIHKADKLGVLMHRPTPQEIDVQLKELRARLGQPNLEIEPVAPEFIYVK
jgi:hypothetical protein